MVLRQRHEISRLEGFSDAAFAFALTLLVVSLDVPRSYGQLLDRINGLLSFACCFALLIWIWYEHNLFFRRHGLQDPVTVALNGALLFVVLFYVYPLKFMFDSMFESMIPPLRGKVEPMTLEQLASASAIYSTGFVVLFGLFVMLYQHAKRQESDISPAGALELRLHTGEHLVSVAIGVLALLASLFLPIRWSPLAPAIFGLMGPAHWAYGTWAERRRRDFLAVEASTAVEPAGS